LLERSNRNSDTKFVIRLALCTLCEASEFRERGGQGTGHQLDRSKYRHAASPQQLPIIEPCLLRPNTVGSRKNPHATVRGI
jgi:hypothetical protein